MVKKAPETVDQQEHLSLAKLKKLYSNEVIKRNTPLTDRPEGSLSHLIEWVSQNFTEYLADQTKINSYLHASLTIDGQLMEYCQLNKVAIRCLYKGSIISWETDEGTEKFFAQGVFHLSGNGIEFLAAALFHKRNHNEDEITFFNLVSEKNYEAYIKFRNDYDNWSMAQTRNNLFITVINGDDIPYDRDNSWDDLFLPKEIKTDIMEMVENFLGGEEFYKKNKLPWKRGLLLWGAPGNGKSSIVKTIISNYNLKPITLIPGANDEAAYEAFAFAKEQSPSLLFFEDLDSILESGVSTSSFLNLMDGVAAKNGVFIIATANDLSRLKTNITDRPSRFDRKFEIPLPDIVMASLYLRKQFGVLLTVKQTNELAKHAVQYQFSYAYLKELFISSMFEALANKRKAPNDKDIAKALSKLMKDKQLGKAPKIISLDRYSKRK